MGPPRASKTNENHHFSFGTHLGLGPSWGRLGSVLEASWDGLGASWGVLERLGGVLGGLEVSWAPQELLKPMKNHYFSFWYPLWSRAVLGPSWGRLGGVLGRGRLGASWGTLGASWGRLSGVLGCLGASWGVLGNLGVVLGASFGRLRASWGVLGASWGLLGCILGRLEPCSACPRGVSEPSWPSKPTQATQSDAKRLFTMFLRCAD